MPGRKAYEADCKRWPTYHNGAQRPAWDDLPESAQQAWEQRQARGKAA